MLQALSNLCGGKSYLLASYNLCVGFAALQIRHSQTTMHYLLKSVSKHSARGLYSLFDLLYQTNTKYSDIKMKSNTYHYALCAADYAYFVIVMLDVL